MSDQISLNLNVLLRSLVSAAMVLVFMFTASWRLTAVTFVVVPVQLSVSKIYGTLYRRLNKQTLEELANANSVAEQAISAMGTVRSFAAEHAVHSEYYAYLIKYWTLQARAHIVLELCALNFIYVLSPMQALATQSLPQWYMYLN